VTDDCRPPSNLLMVKIAHLPYKERDTTDRPAKAQREVANIQALGR
jgi:hypothetical protein